MQLNNPLEVMNHLISLLAAEGVEAFIGKVAHEYDVNELEDGLRIPAWENDKQELSRKAVYEFIFAKLAANPRKGFITEMPGVPNTLNVYTINPCKLDAGSELNCWDVMVWCAGSSIDSFNWEECVEGDDSAWWEGWDIPHGFGLLSRRVANLLILMHYKLVELQLVKPFSEAELIQKVISNGDLYCESGDHTDRWKLRLSPAGTLVLHKQSDDSQTPITHANINDMGGVVLDGRTIMHRSWNY